MSCFAVDVPGGSLTVHDLSVDPDGPDTRPTVLALHGITANGLSFAGVAGALGPGYRVLAPDLRGRADSNSITGPWGLDRHADDAIAVLDALNLPKVLLVGHSMGAFVAGLAAAEHPDRFDRVVLVDGGLGFALPIPDGTPIDAVLTAVLGPAMDRLSVTFPSREAYLEFWSQHPAVAPLLAEPASAPDVVAYLQHDLRERSDGSYGSSCVLEAIRIDGGEVLAGPRALAALGQAAGNPDGPPITLLWAERGMQNEPAGMYNEERLVAVPENVAVQAVPGTNHYSILLNPAGTSAIANVLQAGR